MSRRRRLVLSELALAAPVSPRIPQPPRPPGSESGAATLPALGKSVTYRALHESGGDLKATVRGYHRHGGLDIDVHIPGASEALALTNIRFHADVAPHPRGTCFERND